MYIMLSREHPDRQTSEPCSVLVSLRELKLAETGLWPFDRVYSTKYCIDEAFRAEVDGAFAAMGFGFDEDGNPQKHSQS
jgi:hypothetical protein